MNSPPHTEGKLYTCIKCKEEFPLELDPKILEIVGESLLCDTCSETHQPSAYYGQQQLEENSSVDGTPEEVSKCEVFLVSDTGEDIYSCDVCCKTFSGASDLCAHLQDLPDEKLSNQPCDYYGQQQLEENSSVDGTLDEASKFKVFLVSDTGENIYSCDVCCKTFSGDSDLCTHLQHFKKLSICGFCNKTFGTRSELKSHAITHTGKKQHVCSVCSRAFSRRSYLRVHTRMHTGEKPYVCDVCSAAFGQKSGLLLHASSHTGQKPFKCGHCPLTFVQSSHLRMHMRVHTGEKPYVCDVCDKAFAQRGTLLQHMRFHTGESPFACDVCDKTYSRNSYLKNHMRSHTGEKPYVCDACSVAFAQRFQLLAHSCPAAKEVSYRSGKSTTIYVKAPTLTVRKRVAKEESLASGAASEQRISEVLEKNHVCGECKKAFSNVYDLKFHQRSHEEEDTFFECDMCFKSFIKRDSLKLHQWRCHELNWNRLKFIKNFK